MAGITHYINTAGVQPANVRWPSLVNSQPEAFPVLIVGDTRPHQFFFHYNGTIESFSGTTGYSLRVILGDVSLGPIAGNYSLTCGETTLPIAWNAASGDIGAALNLLPTIKSSGGVAVLGAFPNFIVSWLLPGAQTALTASAIGLVPVCSIGITSLQSGDATHCQQTALQLQQSPITNQSSWSQIASPNNGWSGSLNTNTAEAVSLLISQGEYSGGFFQYTTVLQAQVIDSGSNIVSYYQTPVIIRASNLDLAASISPPLSGYTLGDILYGDASGNLARLPGNTSATEKLLAQTGTGSVSAPPSWVAFTPGSAVWGSITGTLSNQSDLQTALNGKQPLATILSTFSALANASGWLHNDGAGVLAYSTPTKADVGLGNVENTALSTWAGSTNLITLGTIATGAWQGTAIADSYIASAATWNAKQNALTIGNFTEATSAVLTITGGTGAIIGSGLTVQVKQSGATQSGYLSSTDWSTFNSKGSGTVTSISIASSNGFAGSSSGGATPILTLQTSISGILKGNGTAISAATAATDYVAPSAYASANGLTMATARLLGRTTAASGAAEEIQVTTGLSLSAGVLSCTVTAPTGANPTASIGLSAVNGSAATFMRSDGAPALSQSIAPTWAGVHIFNAGNLTLQDTTTTGKQLIFASNSSTALTANHILTIDVVNADRMIKLTGNPTLADWFDQAVKTTSSPTHAALTLNANSGALPSPLTGTILQAGGADGVQSRTLLDSFGNVAQYIMRRANGTNASKSNLLNNDIIGGYVAFGYGATGYSAQGKANLNFAAAEDWTDTHQGTYVTIGVTAPGTTTIAVGATITSTGINSTDIGQTTAGKVTGSTITTTGNFSGPAAGYSIGVSGDSYIDAFQVFGSGAGGAAHTLVATIGGTAIGTFTSTALNILGQLSASLEIIPKAVPSANWSFDGAARGSQSIGASGNYDLATGSGLVMIHDNNTGSLGVFICYAGNTAKLGGATDMVATSPGGSQIGFYWTGSVYRITNGYAAAHDIFITTIKTRTAS